MWDRWSGNVRQRFEWQGALFERINKSTRPWIAVRPINMVQLLQYRPGGFFVMGRGGGGEKHFSGVYPRRVRLGKSLQSPQKSTRSKYLPPA